MKKLVAIAALTLVSLSIPTAAFAQTDRTARRTAAADEVKSRCLNQIDRRQKALSVEKARLQKAKFLADAHQAALETINSQTSSGLATLADTIQSEDNFEELRAECRQIVEGFRVFALVRPQARLVLASDRILAAADRLTVVADDLQSAEMHAAIDAARAHASGVYDAVIGLKPADFNANPNVLDPSRENVRSAKDSVKQAVDAGRAARHALQPADA